MSEEIRNPKSEIRKGEGRTGQRPEVSGQESGQKPVASHQLPVVGENNGRLAGTLAPPRGGSLETGGCGQSKEPAGEMLTKRELAGRLKIAARTVENWQRRGILSYIKVGKVVLFHWPDVVAYLKCNYQVSRRSLRIRREVIGAGSNTGKTL